MEAGMAYKIAQSQIREYKQIQMKAGSTAGSTKSKKWRSWDEPLQ